ncbi:MAG TPA: hypothetical protein VFU09_02750 [Candidatus Udaeobacter sp.]|nr:hypothetical protein [Candidatus Udaeobacter sp.]
MSLNDWLAETELAGIAQAKAKANGTYVEPKFCDCVELLVGGVRQPCPERHDCSYVEMRSALVPRAVEYANMQSGNCNGKGEWVRHFADVMEELAAPLLNHHDSSK